VPVPTWVGHVKFCFMSHSARQAERAPHLACQLRAYISDVRLRITRRLEVTQIRIIEIGPLGNDGEPAIVAPICHACVNHWFEASLSQMRLLHYPAKDVFPTACSAPGRITISASSPSC
jgi:hypothetical protein